MSEMAAIQTSNKGVTDTSNIQSSIPSKVVSSSTRPTTINDKENLPSSDKQSRPSTTFVGPNSSNDHALANGATANGIPSSILASGSIDTSTSNTSGSITVKPNTSNNSQASNVIQNRTNTNTEKYRAQTVRLPNTNVRRRETIDPVPSEGGSMRKGDPTLFTNDKNKTTNNNPGEKYV